MFRTVLVVLAMGLAAMTAGSAVEWKNLDEGHRRGGRRVSQGYLQGKVVLVCREVEHHERMAAIWESLNTKQFVLVGAYAKAPEDVVYPVYEGAGLRQVDFEDPIYIVDETGRLRYHGANGNLATQVAVLALTDMESPRDVKQWKYFLDYELRNLPAHAYNRLKLFNRLYPEEACAYRELAKDLVMIPEVKAAAEFVEFAKMAKDHRSFAACERGKRELYEKMLESALTGSKYTGLRDRVQDERMLQEVKNGFADLKWTQAEL